MPHPIHALSRLTLGAMIALASPSFAQVAEDATLEDLGFGVDSIDVEVKEEPQTGGPKNPNMTAPPIESPNPASVEKNKLFQFHGVFGAGMVGFKTDNGFGKEMSILASDITTHINEGGKLEGFMRVNVGCLLIAKKAEERLKSQDGIVFKKTMYGVLAQAKAASAQAGAPMPPTEALVAKAQELTNAYVDEHINGQVKAEACGREYYLTYNRNGRVEVQVGKMNPIYFKGNPWSHHRISSPAIRVTTSLTSPENQALKIKVYGETYDSRGYRRISNPSGSTTDYIAHHLMNPEPGNNLLSFKLNESQEFGGLFEIAKQQFTVAFGRRGSDVKGRYGLFQYDGNPLGFFGERAAKLHVNFQATREGIEGGSLGSWKELGRRLQLDYKLGANNKYEVYYWNIKDQSTNQNPGAQRGFTGNTLGLTTTVKTWKGGARGVKLVTEGGVTRPIGGKQSPSALAGFVTWF